MSVEELQTYCEQNNLPQPLREFIKGSNSHLNLCGAQHCMYKQRITDDMLISICSVLKRHTSDHIVLDLGCNELTDACIPTLIDLFSNKTIIGLSLRANRLTSACGEGLADLIRASRLVFLSLAQNPLYDATEAVMEQILVAPALHYGVLNSGNQPRGTLQYLDVSETGFTESANVHLCQYLASRFCGLRELRLADCRFNSDSHTMNGFYRFVDALKYNTTLEALSIRQSPQLDDDLFKELIKALDCQVATQQMFEQQLSILKKKNLISLYERVEQMQKLQQRNLRAAGFPDPLQKISTTPLRYLDISSCRALSFDVCINLAQHLTNCERCYLKVLIFDGVRIQNKGINVLSEALIKYQLTDFETTAIMGSQKQYLNTTYDLFGCFDAEDDAKGYDQNHQNVTLQSMFKKYKPDPGLSLSARRCSIGGQGLATLALLTKLNKQLTYVAVQNNDLVVEHGITSNDQTIWHPAIEWELAFSVRTQAGAPVYCDFGLERAELERGRLQFYKRPQKVLRAIAVFE